MEHHDIPDEALFSDLSQKYSTRGTFQPISWLYWTQRETVAMNPPDEFLKHAADCEQMAKFARDPESKATWNRMAVRWRQCAEKFTSESFMAHHEMPAKRRQGAAA
jgi:hypothetical protein